MLIPSGKPLFENLDSKAYYSKAGELRNKAFSGCVHIKFYDFEEVIFFSAGQPAAAVQQVKRWLTVGDDLVEPAENKTLAMDGKMAAYELPPAVLDIFIHKRIQTMVETELGAHMTAGLLVSYLEGDKSTCVVKLEDSGVKAYVFINFGKLAGAVLESPEGRTYGKLAVNALGRFKEHTYVAIYFTEPTPKYLKSKAEARSGGFDEQVPVSPAKLILPTEPATPFPVEAPRPVEVPSPVQIVRLAHVPPAPEPAIVRLVVAMSADRKVGLAHRSRHQALEVFEEGNVAWVDEKTLASLHLTNPKAYIVLPGGREYAVTLKEVLMQPPESRYIILPRKLRSRLSIAEGTALELKASP